MLTLKQSRRLNTLVVGLFAWAVALLLFFLVLGLPLAFVLGGVSVIFLYFTWGPDAFYMVASQIWSTMGNFTLVAIPLFVFMAMVLERTGVAKDLYRMMYLWWGGLRGGISIALALSLPSGPVRDLILAATFGAVLFSVLIQRATLGRLIELLKRQRAEAVEGAVMGTTEETCTRSPLD